MKSFDQELVSGSVLRSVWKLAWPGVLLFLANGSAGFIDHIMVGHFVESPSNAANAAMGVAWQLYLVIVVFIASLFNGMGVLIAQYSGRQDRDTVGRIAYTTFITVVYFQIFVIAPLGYFAAPLLLDLFNASSEVQLHALPYMRIMFTCSLFIFIMLMVNNAMQASGDPRMPLKLAVLSSVLNVSLTYCMINGVGPFPQLDALGAAVATVIAPIPSVAIAMSLVIRHRLVIRLPDKLTPLPELDILKSVIKIGIPTGIQAVLLNLGGAALLGYVGLLEHSAAAQAAYTICYAQWFALIAWTSFGLRAASATLIGQNIGAGDMLRGKDAVRMTALLGAVIASCLGLLFFTIPEKLMWVFNATDEPVLGFGVSFLRVLAFSGVFLATTLAFTGGLQGAGDTKKPMWIALITQIGILLGVCEALRQMGLLTANAIWWTVLLSHGSRFVLTFYFFQRGRWKALEIPTYRSNAQSTQP